MSEDSDLREQFDKLKSQDALSVKPFTAYWEEAGREQASTNAGRRNLWVFNPAAIAAALVLTAIAVFMVHSRSPRPASISQMSQWRSPTNFLLETPGSRLFTTLPRFGEPLILSLKEQQN